MNTGKTAAECLRENILQLMEENKQFSMRQLSLRIGVSESYMQKVLAGTICPSLEKVDAISEYFGRETWELLSDPDEDTKAYAKTIDMMSGLSDSQLSVLRDYMEYLLTLQD